MTIRPHLSRISLRLGIVALAAAACGKMGGSGGGASGDPKTDDEKVFYALGLDIGKNIDVFTMSPRELELVKAGISDVVSKQKPKVELDAVRPKIFEMARKRQEMRTIAEKAKGKETADKAGKEAGADKLPSGVVVKMIRPGTGDSPAEADSVKVNYEGRLADGTVFDSSYKRNQPAEFSLRGVVKCWTEGLQKLKIGAKAQLTCPSDVAYGDQGRPPSIPGGATLIFDIELLEIKKAEPPKPVELPKPGEPVASSPGAGGKPAASAALAAKPGTPVPPAKAAAPGAPAPKPAAPAAPASAKPATPPAPAGH